MAMTLPIALPPSPNAGASPASDDASTNTNTNNNSNNNSNNNNNGSPVSPSISDSVLDSTNNNVNTTNNINNNNGAAGAGAGAAAAGNGAAMKRKPSRRANTAERRATHNAVERQRRETLNGRFLDLAALLPNLSQIRRPSKSSIVNSSIAHIHASRRHRLLASRELRLLKLEADALRRELNEWRDRAGIPRVDEPVRGEGFSMVLSGELELVVSVPGEEEDEEGSYANGGGYAGAHGGMMEDDDEYSAPPMSAVSARAGFGDDEMEDHRIGGVGAMKSSPFAHNIPPTSAPSAVPIVPPSAVTGNGVHLTHIVPRSSGGYDNGMGMYDAPHHLHHSHHQQQQVQQHNGNAYPSAPHFLPHHREMEAEKMAAFAHAQHAAQQQHHHQQQQQQQMYNAHAHHQQQQHMMQQQQRALFTPPASSHGLPNGPTTTAGTGPGSTGTASPTHTHSTSSPPLSAGIQEHHQQQAFFANLQRQQAQAAQAAQMMHHGYGSGDDSPIQAGAGMGLKLSLRGGGGGGRERAGSTASPGGSPAYELSPTGEYGVPRRTNGAGGGAGNGAGWRGDEIALGAAGLGGGLGVGVGGGLGVGVGVGVGGGGGGFAMMM